MDAFPGLLIDPAAIVFTAIVLTAVSGLPGLALAGHPGPGQRIASGCSLIGGIMGVCASLAILTGTPTAPFTIAWTLPFGPCDVAVDPLSALFLLPIFLISGCSAIYARSYWPAATNPDTEPLLTFSAGLLAAAMASVVVARNGVFFLMAWEIMALAAGIALTVEHRRREVRQACSIYLIATHTGTLGLFVMFALLRATTGSFQLPAGASLAAASLPASLIFLCALFGFGSKAGIMPFHIWLPAAHANAPSHISALMSGVMLKIGLYGIIRVLSLFHGQPLWWGIILLACGSFSALLGIVFAIAQHDLKRLLAYSSIENIGIVAIGLGVAVIGIASHRPLLGLLGLAGALLHALNHSLFKPLLFMGAGALIHATGSRLTDLMGGLARRMPWTAGFFVVGAVAICGLPPLNGFAGEFLLYHAFFADATTSPAPYLALAAPLLALVGGLATLCFVKLLGVAMLGEPRSAAAAHGHEAGWGMLAPMGFLALLCAIFGIVPQLLLSLILPAVTVIAPALAGASSSLATTAPLGWLTVVGAMLMMTVLLLALLLRNRFRLASMATGPTWGCGYMHPRATMQYTASSVGETAVRLFKTAVRHRFIMPHLAGYFPHGASFRSHCPDSIVEQIILPAFRATEYVFSFCRQLQHGKQEIYILYIFTTLLLLMVWAH